MLPVTLVALAVLPMSAAAQAADSVPTRLQTVMSTLDQRAIVRVRLRSGVWAAGPYRGSDGSNLEVGPYIGFGEEPQRVPLAGTDSLWTRGTAIGSMTWRGAILGSILSAAVAGVTTTCEGSQSGSRTNPKYCTSDVATAAAGGAVAGAVLGAFIGSSTPRWRLQFGRSRPEPPAWAVATDDTVPVSWQLWTAVSDLRYKASIRLRMAGGPDIEGLFERATATGIQLRPHDWLQEGPPPVAPAAGIRGLFERGDRRKEMMILGGAIGLGLAMAFAVDDTCALFPGGQESTSRCSWRFVGSSVLGGIGGAWLGRFIGQQMPRWHRRF